MIRDLHFSDVPRQLLPGGLGGEDWAYTRASLSTGTRRLSEIKLLRWSVSSSKRQQAIASVARGRLQSVAVLRARRGVGAWEIAHLFTSPHGLPQVGDLLERCVGFVSQRGGDRLFLRVLYHCPMQDLARRAGFMPAYTEETFVLRRPMSAEVDAPALVLRPVLPADTHGLFRLYNASTPAHVRPMLGLTLDQWRDALEQPNGKPREYVWETAGQVRAWLRLAHRKKGLEVDALLHPDHSGQALALSAAAARLARAHGSVVWVVPSYQPALSLALQRRGWELAGTYALMARSAASRVREPGLMPVQA